MRRNFRYFLLYLMFCLFAGNGYSQITFSIDSLHISNVIWINPSNVWIEDFGYGPYIELSCTINNNGVDTLVLKPGDYLFYIESRIFYKKKSQPVITDLERYSMDTVLVIPPKSSKNIKGYAEPWIDGETVFRMNYRFVNFLPAITKMVTKGRVVLKMKDGQTWKDTFHNCYIDKPFFIDGTDHSSIYNVE